MTLALPKYLEELQEEDARKARCKFLLRLAALYFTPEGRLSTLSEALGLYPTTLAGMDNCSPETAIKLESLLGRETFPRELFRPDLFKVETAHG